MIAWVHLNHPAQVAHPAQGGTGWNTRCTLESCQQVFRLLYIIKPSYLNVHVSNTLSLKPIAIR
jgi:hypothetical protein